MLLTNTVYRYMAPVLFLVVLLALGGCSDEDVTRVDMSKREQTSVAKDKTRITYAYLPQYSHTISYRRHRLLVEYLREATGLPLHQIFPDTFDDHLKMVERGEIDISFSNPFVYIQIAEFGGRAFARIVEPDGNPDFRGQIIVNADNDAIRRIEDCRGKRWIAVDPSSAGGFLFPLGLFADHGLHKTDFSEIAFAPGPGGKQEKVVLAVYAGAYDIGSIREGTLSVLDGKIDVEKIRVLAQTRAYPGWVFASRKGLDPEIVEKISAAMYTLDIRLPEHAAILDRARVSGIIPARDSDYDPIRELAQKLGLF